MAAAPAMTAPTPDEDRLAAIAELLRKADALPSGPPPMALGEHIIAAARIPARHREALLKLTPTELTVVRFMGWGRSNTDIATLLVISDNTVRVHTNNVVRKLELDGMRELAALAGLLFYPVD